MIHVHLGYNRAAAFPKNNRLPSVPIPTRRQKRRKRGRINKLSSYPLFVYEKVRAISTKYLVAGFTAKKKQNDSRFPYYLDRYCRLFYSLACIGGERGTVQSAFSLSHDF